MNSIFFMFLFYLTNFLQAQKKREPSYLCPEAVGNAQNAR